MNHRNAPQSKIVRICVDVTLDERHKIDVLQTKTGLRTRSAVLRHAMTRWHEELTHGVRDQAQRS